MVTPSKILAIKMGKTVPIYKKTLLTGMKLQNRITKCISYQQTIFLYFGNSTSYLHTLAISVAVSSIYLLQNG